MLWEGRRGSSNIEDRRGISGGHIAVGGGIGLGAGRDDRREATPIILRRAQTPQNIFN